MAHRPLVSLLDIVRRKILAFSAARGGQIAVVFGLSVTMIVTGVGAGIDLSRAFQAKQKLAEVATLGCQYASRPSVVQTSTSSYTGTNGGATYVTAVKNYIAAALVGQKFTFSQTNTTPFTYTQNGTADISLASSVPTSFMKLVNVTQIPVTATAHCYDSPSSIQQGAPNGNSPYVVQEGFEASKCSGSCYTFYTIPGHAQSSSSPPVTSSPTYTGSNGTVWYGSGYCLEIDSAGIIRATTPEGSHSAELDCDNGTGSAGNSAISTKVYLATGNYELRYNYTRRVQYPDYDPTYLCGSTASDLTWANSTNASGGPVSNALRTNQMNVYLDLNTNGSPPTHTTMMGSQQLAGANLIDMCVYSSDWVERSIRVYVNTPGYYWLSFAGDGQNESYGAQLDNIRLCNKTCPGGLQDNFPTTWLAANNGGTNKVLFEDRFESPSYNTSNASNGDLTQSMGTSGASSSGWPNQTNTGWGTGPYNQVDYITALAAEGNQAIELDGKTGNGMSTSNRLTSRPFLLEPGYYSVSYYYKSNKPVVGLLLNTYCGSTPAGAGINSTTFAGSKDTNFVGVFMSHAQLANTPVSGALYSATTYNASSPSLAPNSINVYNYDSTQSNPLLDICGYATAWQARSANIFITKPAYYWLTLSALGTSDSAGGLVDDVKVTALGSPYMSSPPNSAVTIPVPDPQPSDRVTPPSDASYFIIADPVAAPAPMQ